jgi:TatA/E family protein of Tat protein translocase
LFGIGGWEFVLIAGLALLLFGPDKLPQFARTIGRFMRDFKRYQDLMESTIRAEVFAADPSLRKDPFNKGKEFREKVAGGAFSKPEPSAEPSSQQEPAADGEIAEDEPPVPAADGEIAEDEPAAPDDGEGDRVEA